MAWRRTLGTVLGAICTALSLELCYIPYRFLDGGMTGLAVITGRLLGIGPTYVLFVFNFLALLLGARALGSRFIWRAAAGFLTLGVVLTLVGPLPPLLPAHVAALAGGAGVGLGVGIVLRSGGVLDGCEILGLVLHRAGVIPIAVFLLLLNAALFATAAALYGVAVSLYSIVAQGSGLVVLALLLRGYHLPDD